MVRVTTDGKTRVGVLLEDMPADVRSQYAADTLAQPDSWWIMRARYQLRLTTYKLTFMSIFFGPEVGQLMLPLEDAAIKITMVTPAVRHVVDGHDIISRRYKVETYLIASAGSSVKSNAAFASIGGSYTVNYTLPIDPFLLVQRTGWACQDEDQFPHYSLDARNPDVYYDDTCEAGEAVPLSQQCVFEVTGCHCAYSAKESCVEALVAHVGKTSMDLIFTRVAWDETLAQQYESYNLLKHNPKIVGADLVGYIPGMENNWVSYQYYHPNSCEFQECLTAPGWRKLLIFDSIHANVGTEDFVVGSILYAAYNASSFDQASWHNMYYWGVCHGHPHFAKYNDYIYDPNGQDLPGHKQGFCMQSTTRAINARTTPLYSPFWTCSNQGISAGWADNYNGGIPCQWVDITTEEEEKRAPLQMIGNPSRWLCEGVISYDASDKPVWVFSGSNTTNPPWPVAGLPVDIYKCDTSKGAWDNNVDNYDITVPIHGYGALTSPCVDGKSTNQVHGPKRDCEMIPSAMMSKCSPGRQVTLRCTIAAGATSQVLRVCESSIALQAGTACRYNQDFMLANVVIPPLHATTVQFTCPKARDAVEVGGYFSLYYGAAYNQKYRASPVTCQVV